MSLVLRYYCEIWLLTVCYVPREIGQWELLTRDHDEWNALLKYAMEKGDEEVPIPSVLNEIAANVERLHLPT